MSRQAVTSWFDRRQQYLSEMVMYLREVAFSLGVQNPAIDADGVYPDGVTIDAVSSFELSVEGMAAAIGHLTAMQTALDQCKVGDPVLLRLTVFGNNHNSSFVDDCIVMIDKGEFECCINHPDGSSIRQVWDNLI